MSVPMAWGLALTAVLLTAAAQLLLKAGALRMHGRHIVRLWLNPWVLVSYSLYLGVAMMNLYSFQVLPLKLFVVLSSLVLLLVVLGSRFFFLEELNRQALAGMALVLIGMVVFHLSM